MRRTKDKFNETKYHCRNLFIKFDQIEEVISMSELIKLIDTIRYDLNNFANSYRATTFTLQSELKSKHNDTFIKWYEVAKKPLILSEYSNLLKEIRNLNQKNGNNYIAFNISYSSVTSKIYFDINLTNYGKEMMKPTNIEFKKPLQVKISNGTSQDLTKNDKELVYAELAKEVSKLIKEVNPKNISNFKLENIKIIKKRFTVPEFKNIVNEQMIIMKTIIDDGVDKFEETSET